MESSVGSDEIAAEALATFRETLSAATDALRAKIDELEPRTREAEERLKQLGPAPAKDAAPESADIANEREELTKQFSELDGELKQARVLSLRVDQLSDRVSQKRHSLYASELFARSPSVLDPFFWLETFQALPKEVRTAKALLATWFGERGDRLRWTAGALIIVGVIALAVGLTRWWFPRFVAQPTETQSAKAWAALTAAFLAHLVIRLGQIKKDRGEALLAASWAHPLGLLMAVLISLALVAGYAGLAAFVALRVIVAAAVFGALYLLMVITQTLLATVGEQTAKWQTLAASLRVSARTIGFGGALLSAAIRVILILASFLLIIGPWEVSTADLFDTIRNIPFGFKIGEIHL